ncbi:MAG: 50S ribosomal protein L17 [Chitinophagaceae bacterium]
MRHGDKINNLGRKAAHRKALLKNLACALIKSKGIVTTLAKAKALRIYVEPLITRTKKADTKENAMHQQRIIFSYLQNEEASKELFTVIGPKILSRLGGYTRIIKLGQRKTDSSKMAFIQLVDFTDQFVQSVVNENTTENKEMTKKTRRGSKKKIESEEATLEMQEKK